MTWIASPVGRSWANRWLNRQPGRSTFAQRNETGRTSCYGAPDRRVYFGPGGRDRRIWQTDIGFEDRSGVDRRLIDRVIEFRVDLAALRGQYRHEVRGRSDLFPSLALLKEQRRALLDDWTPGKPLPSRFGWAFGWVRRFMRLFGWARR